MVPVVDFAVAGMQKAGTSALYDFLRQHPDVLVPIEKEVHFFDYDLPFPPWGPMYDLYHSYFPDAERFKAVGDVTPSYLYIGRAVDRMRDYNSAMKIVVVLRNPVDRAYSHYQMMRRLTPAEPFGSFAAALIAEPSRLRRGGQNDDLRSAKRIHAYYSRGLYSKQIRYLLDRFPSEQVLFLRSEDLRHAHQETMRSVYSFIGVDDSFSVRYREAFAGRYEPMSPGVRRWLTWRYRNEFDDLERLLGWDMTSWRAA